MRAFFAKIISDLKSERETHISREQDTIEITYPAIGKEDLRNNRHAIPILLLISLFFVIGMIVSLTVTLSSSTGMPHETLPGEWYILLFPLVAQLLFGIVTPVFIYRKAIRPLFITEKLTLTPSYFTYSLSTWGSFKELIRIRKTDLVAFTISGNPSPVLRLMSKGTDRNNHLYVHYNKNKKKEIMGGRSDDEYRKIIDVLESYRTSADIYEMAKSISEREQSAKTEQSMSTSKKREGWIKRIKRLLSAEPLVEKTSLRTNGVIGLLMLPSIVFFIIGDKTDSSIPHAFIYVSITAGIVLAGGYLLAVCCPSLTRRILVLQGAVICLLVFIYTFFMWYVAQAMIAGEEKGGMGHAPGILAYGAAYGIKQVFNFSGLWPSSGIVRRLPVIFFVIGACCDIFVVYLIYKGFSS
ncbi:MAG: hypothetical protein SWH61_10845 [Thermodesulfobacteriota bacterium]|nr:hypothetical protein [Thermodesulfobacteriota bacterium]